MKQMEPMKVLLFITSRGSGRKWIDALKKHHINYHLQLSGKGTASSAMMDILGLENSDKDLIVSFCTVTAAADLAQKMSEGIRNVTALHGVMMILPLAAMNHLSVVMASQETRTGEQKGWERMQKSEHEYSLVLVAVNQGYMDQVMQTAKSAGATGGTILRARLADSDHAEQFYGIALQSEREVLAILTPGNTRNSIMEAVNSEFGMRTQAQAILCALPVDKAFKM